MCEQQKVAMKEIYILVVEKIGSLPISYTVVSLGEVWLLQASELDFFLPAVENGSHCRPSGLLLAGMKFHILTGRQKSNDEKLLTSDMMTFL